MYTLITCNLPSLVRIHFVRGDGDSEEMREPELVDRAGRELSSTHHHPPPPPSPGPSPSSARAPTWTRPLRPQLPLALQDPLLLQRRLLRLVVQSQSRTGARSPRRETSSQSEIIRLTPHSSLSHITHAFWRSFNLPGSIVRSTRT